MADHALIVGCDAYPHVPYGGLRGAVADALAMRDWLVGAGGVPPENVTLLLSGSSIGRAVPDAGVSGVADRSRFAVEIARLVALTEVDQDRLYVYFAGHGCRSDPLNPALATDVLAFTGFRPDDPSPGTVGVAELRRKLQLSRFRDVVVALDACRNFPFAEPFQVGGIGRDPLTGTGRTPSLYLLQATQPGWDARGDETADGVRGRLTGALLDGLAGRHTAKRYVEADDLPYAVTWSSLVEYVTCAMQDQVPHDESPSRELVLARFPDDHFHPVKLTVDVDPPESAASSDLRVEVSHWKPAAPDDARMTRPGPAPAHFIVPPRRQVVRATHGAQWGRVPVDVYADRQITVTLDGPHSRPQPLPEQAGSVRGRGADEGAAVVITDDPVAAVEVRTLAGRPVGAGPAGYSGDLPDGQYLVMVTDADGRERWEPLDIMAGFRSKLRLTSPRPSGAEDRPGLSPWAGPAAALAVRLLGNARPDEFVCLVGDGPRLSEALAHRVDGGTEPVRGSSPSGTRLATQPSTRLLDLRFGAHRLEITAVAGLAAAVVFAVPQLQVSYFDSALVRDESALLLLDRAQRLMAAGRDRAARIVLGRRLPESRVASRLLAAPPAPTEPYRLRGPAWEVYLDRPPLPAR